ncbi:MAG: Fur family transcriptional regulator [Lactovum sp.]
MPKRSSYTTKQGRILLDYIASIQGEHVTVEQISQYFESQEKQVGLTTIYRQLDKLVKNGQVRKYIIAGNASTFYEYIADPHEAHSHYKCENCGEIIHLKCDSLEDLSEHLLAHHGFQVNQAKTVFYGSCKSCLETQ